MTAAEKIIDLVHEQRDSCGMITREELIQSVNQQVQKAVLEALEKETIQTCINISLDSSLMMISPRQGTEDKAIDMMIARAKEYFDTQVKPRYTK